jgi:lysine-N-methylase
MLEHLRPQYAKQFRCIGSDCEDTCCYGLDVVIDKTAYERFQSHPDYQPRVDEHFVVITNPTEAQYARIQLTPSFNCPFLSGDRLCAIHQEHGEYYLPEVCASYPRVTQKIDGLNETALLLSCPEAARLVLLNPNLLPSEETALPRYHRFTQMVAGQAAQTSGSPHQYLWEIRGFTLLLLSDRVYPLWQRLFILGMFCKRLNEITLARQLGLVPHLLKEYSEMIAQGRLGSSLDGIPVRTAQQLAVVIEIVHHYLERADASHIRFRECVQDFLQGIHHLPASPVEVWAPFYEEANTRYYQPFMRKHPHILENLLVNHVFRTRFPYGVDPLGQLNDPGTEYLLLCVRYAVIKGLLIGMAGHYQKAFAESHVVKLVQSFAKAVEHGSKLLGAVNPNLANADGMALLFKNDE